VNKREKTTVKGLAVSPLKYWLSGIPLMRDIATGIFDGYDYRGGLMGNVIEQGKRLVQALNAKGPDKSKAVASNILKATGYATGLPPDQFIIIMEMALDANRGRKRIGPDNLIWRRKE